MNVFGKVWITHKNLGSFGISFGGQTPRFHTPRFVQGIEVELDERKRASTMFQQATKCNVTSRKCVLVHFGFQ